MDSYKTLHDCYIEHYLQPIKIMLFTNKATNYFKNHDVKFDTLVFTGFSGAVVAPSVAIALDKKLVMIKKPYYRCHCSSYSSTLVHGPKTVMKYVIIDDAEVSGRTLNRMLKVMDKYYPSANCSGFYEYFHPRFRKLKNGTFVR